ncbi:hypothetical protein PC129_g20679 [Phytophthora cactorum]|uniref:Uncharacterized protein n=1 Tax=Phytophthora cactorum TaxID=29920 RepID=A0A329RMU5_9STRA|nr:hypothetical protein Pcac1_g28314 [Phytophthora cactorum]KAG2796737.1 hypothetical protein PC111_g21597 [Phytophthora cactorum]KAG2798194.1 hypothetical protein PC112_g21464 [Phytophthora cactorum]KAG2825735.1 hypothetical protein PC113_g21868 [Phytophthora cactorum]KAG2876773.1 hypothetical protein PC114_g24022 [Phytophthora cactorum]
MVACRLKKRAPSEGVKNPGECSFVIDETHGMKKV